jgi:hypothetical protein
MFSDDPPEADRHRADAAGRRIRAVQTRSEETVSDGRPILAGVILSGVGIFMLVATLKGYRENNRLDADGVTVAGQIVGGEESRRRRGGRNYKLDVAYSSADGLVRHQKPLPVSKETFEQAGGGGGGEVPVTFLLSDPDVARVGARRDSALGFVAGPVMALVGAAMLVAGVRRRMRGGAPRAE